MSPTGDGRSAGRLPELLAVAAVVITGLVVTVGVAVVVALLAAVVGGAALAGTLLAVTVGLGLLGTAVLAGVSWVAVGRARRAVRPRIDDRRVDWYRRARRLETWVPPARAFDLSTRLEPDEETIVATLQRRYVAGQLDEDEFERELERLLGGHGSRGGSGGARWIGSTDGTVERDLEREADWQVGPSE